MAPIYTILIGLTSADQREFDCEYLNCSFGPVADVFEEAIRITVTLLQKEEMFQALHVEPMMPLEFPSSVAQLILLSMVYTEVDNICKQWLGLVTNSGVTAVLVNYLLSKTAHHVELKANSRSPVKRS